MKTVHFFYFGSIERRSGWIDGYCEVTPTGYVVPPIGKKEAKSEARKQGRKAVFHDSEELARQQLTNEERNETDLEKSKRN